MSAETSPRASAICGDPALILGAGVHHRPAPMRRSGATLTIERLRGHDALPPVDALLREYLRCVARLLIARCGASIDDVEAFTEAQHAAFRLTMPQLFGERGRLLLARLDGAPVGTAALKPVDAEVAEIRRVYVQPASRGHGIARALMLRLIADARAEGYRQLRLETLTAMAEARGLYRSLGFVETGRFMDAEQRAAGAAQATCFMALPLERMTQ